VIDIKKDVLTPKTLSDLVAGHQLPTPLEQKNEQLHRELFQANRTGIPLELVAGLIEGEITELELWGRKSPGYSLTRGAEMMPHDPQRSNSASNLGIYTKFTSSLQNLHCNP
jgi:hypothetical protein